MKKETFLNALKDGKLYASVKYSKSGLSRKIQFLMIMPESRFIINCTSIVSLALAFGYDKFLNTDLDDLISSYESKKNDLFKPLFIKGCGFDAVNDVLNSLARAGFEVSYSYNHLPLK